MKHWMLRVLVLFPVHGCDDSLSALEQTTAPRREEPDPNSPPPPISPECLDASDPWLCEICREASFEYWKENCMGLLPLKKAQ